MCARPAILLVGAAGLAWGHLHAAPPACEALDEAAVVGRNGPFPGSGPLLVESNGRLYESFGNQEVLGLGRNRARHEPRLFSRCFASFVVKTRAAPSPLGALGAGAAALRRRLVENSNIFPAPLRAWLRSIVIGDKSRLSRSLSDAFKKTGLYHLLVVSGQHVSLVALAMSLVLRAPLHLAYALRFIGPMRWPHASAVLTLLSVIGAILYAVVTGMSAASQRAAILFAVWQLTRVYSGSLPASIRLQLAAGLQVLLFPIGFLSEASLMSWAAYLCVIAEDKAKLVTWRSALLAALRLQLTLLVVAGAVFGQLPFVGLLANGLFVSLFSLHLVLGLVLMAWPAMPGGLLTLEMQRSFVEMLTAFSRLCDRWPWLSPSAEAVPAWLRVGLCLAATVVLLNTFRRLSIREYEST